MHRIIILGGGYAGIEAALTLHRKLKQRPDIDITLINRSEYHTLLTELHEVAANRVSDGGVLVPLRHIFEYTRVHVVKDEITDIRLQENKICSQTHEYTYDYLILAGGSQPNYFGIESVERHAFSLWSLDDAVAIREHIHQMFVAASQTPDENERRQMLTFVVCGGGFTGVEMIGELARWQRQLCREYRIERHEVSLILVEAGGTILNTLPAQLIGKTQRFLAALGIKTYTDTPVVEATATCVTLKNGTEISTRTLIWTGGVQACDLSGKTDLALEKRSRVTVNDYQQTEAPNVYCIGDMACGLPALVESALQTGEVAATNIAAEILGKPKKPIKANLHGVMVSVGRWWGVANIMGIRLSGVAAIIMKHLVNLHYLWGIGGFESCIDYLKHEFFREQTPRSIVEQQFVHQRPLFWLVPLRLYLGYMWLAQGLQKLQGGWWNRGMLAARAAMVDLLTQASPEQQQPFSPQTPNPPADMTPNVTPGINLITSHTPDWYAWIINTFIIPHALFFQRVILMTEITLGIAFILGAFTFLAAAVSIGMNINFMLTTGVNDYWYLAAAIAMIAGVGQVFGADRFIMPYLMRQWRYIARNMRIKPLL